MRYLYNHGQEQFPGVTVGPCGDVDLSITDNKQALAKNMFMLGQVMEGLSFTVFRNDPESLSAKQFPGIGQMFRIP